MLRYYFDVRDGLEFKPDDDGLEFDSLDAAEHEAVRASTGIAQDEWPKGASQDVAVQVRDAQGRRVLTVKVSLEVDRAGPPPDPPRA